MAEATMEEVVNVEGTLQPCNICGRTFLPEPLTKHMRVCERNATRKRKVFDSLKQRVEGTELAQFHQRTFLKRQPTPSAPPEANRQSSKWRDKHLELVNTIRAARGLPVETPMSPKRTPSNTTAGSERCPSCERQFGPKAYDRHVEWCKEHRARAHRSPADVLLAKERLEARTKYRVPPPKSKRTLIRDKYSPTLGNRTESSNSIKSISCSNLERSPSIRKQRSVLNTKAEREPIKFEHQSDPIVEIQSKYEENFSKQSTKDKCVPKEQKIPVIDGIKSSHPSRRLPRSKINSTEINSSIEDMTVSHVKMGPGEFTEPRMVTWRDTIHNSNPANVASINSAVVNKSAVYNKKEDTKSKKTNPSRKCCEIHLNFNADSSTPHSNRSLKETKDEIGKHRSKKISFRSMNELTSGNVNDNGGQLNMRSVSKHSSQSLKGKLQVKNNNGQTLDAEDVESDNIMTTKLKVPFSISKYRKTKAASDKKLCSMEKTLPLSSKAKCPTINEYDEDELTMENESYESNVMTESVTSDSSPKNEPQNPFSSSNKVLRTPKNIVKDVCSSCPDNLEIVNQTSAAQPATVCEGSITFSDIANRQNDDIITDNSLLLESLGGSNQTKIYDSHKLKNSDFLFTIQDICSKEKHCRNTELGNDLKQSKTYVHIDSSKSYGNKNKEGDNLETEDVSAKKENISVPINDSNKISKSFAVSKYKNSKDAGKVDEEQIVTKQNLQVDDFENIFAFGRKENKSAQSGSDDKITKSFLLTKHKNLEESGKDDEQNDTKQNLQVNGFENIFGFGREENKTAHTRINNKITKSFSTTKHRNEEQIDKDDNEPNATKQNLQPVVYDFSKTGTAEVRFQACENIETNNKNKLTISSSSYNDIESVETIDSKRSYSNENHKEMIIYSQPYDEIVIPTVAKTIPCMLKFGNGDKQTVSINSSADISEFYTEETNNIKDAGIEILPQSNNLHVCATEDAYFPSNKERTLDMFANYHVPSKSCSIENILEFNNNFDIDSLENCNKISITDISVTNEKTNTFTSDSPQKHGIEDNNNSIDGISVLYEPSHEIAEVESLECVNVDTWNETLSMARIKHPPRKCFSAACLNSHVDLDKRSRSEHDLTTVMYINDTVFQGNHIYFQYQKDNILIEEEHIELQSAQLDGWTSDKILEIAGDQFIATFQGAGDGCGSSVHSLDCVPTKRRKLSPDILEISSVPGTPSECSSLTSDNLNRIVEHNLNKNLEEIKSRKKKFERKLSRGQGIAGSEKKIQIEPFEYVDHASYNNDILPGMEYNFSKKCTNTEDYTENHDSDFDNSRYQGTELEYILIESFEEETPLNNSVGAQLMKNQNNYNLEANYSRPPLTPTFTSVSPRLLDIIESIFAEDDCHVKTKDYRNEDMLLISKDYCKKLLELDPHTLELPSKIKFPEIQQKNEKVSSSDRKVKEDVEKTKFTLPPIKLRSGCASKIPVARSSLGQGSNSPVCAKEPVTFPNLTSPSDKHSDYNPFVTAERQLMELLECDDFKPFFRNKSPSTQQLQRPHTTTNTKSKLTNIHKNNKVVKSAENARKANIKSGPISKRSSVIDPPMDFQDNLNGLSDDFELIERLINQNYADGYDMNNDLNDINFDSISTKIAKSFFLQSDANENNNCGVTTKGRKYSDDLSSIDPRLINENDNLSIPENLKVDDNSSNSSVDNVAPLISNLHKENNQSKRAPRITPTEKINQHDSLAIKKSKQINERSIKPLKQATKGTHKSTASLTSSYGSTRNNLNVDKKRNLSSLKRSVSLVDPVKPKNLRNKQDVENYFDAQDRKNAIKAERTSPDHTTSPERQALKSQKSESNVISNIPTAEELFSVDDEMYEEYKKYEEMYLREKQQTEKKPDDLISSGTLTPNEGSENVPTNVKVSADSAYSSLNRKAPKIRARSTKLAPLDCQGSHVSPPGSPNSSGSEPCLTFHNRSAGSQRMSKFCHECGNKYPINTAKFCVECGVRRLVL